MHISGSARRFLQAFIFSILVLSKSFGQGSIQVIPSVLPPYSTLLSEYYSGDQNRLSVTLLNTDAGEPFLQGYLRMTIEGQGVRLQTLPYGNYPAIDLMSGAPVTLSQSDLAPYFNPQHLSGTGLLQNRLPEGFYQFCFEVLEKNTGRLIGTKQCAQAYLTLSDPAFLTLPEKGKVISNTNPFNLLFQWTPRHVNLINTEYEFTLVEIWDEGIAPEAAFYTAKPIYTTKVNTPNLFYGPGEPQLISGKKYAWRVKTTVVTANNEREPFKNDGYSEIYWFKLQGECPPLQRANVVADPRTNKTTLSWVTDPSNIGNTKLDYRKKGTNKWTTIESSSSQATLTGLEWNTTYEYELGNRCNITDDFAYGSLQTLKTLTQDTNNCVPSLPKTISNREPLAMLRAGDTIYASGFRMRLTQVSGANGTFSGQGYLALLVPTTTTEVSIRAAFNNIGINTDKQLISGRIVSLYDKNEGGIGNIDPITEGGIGVGGVKTGGTSITGTVNVTIDPTIDATIQTVVTGPGDTTYTVTVTSVNDKPVSITTKKLPAIIQDKDGNLYSVDKDGKITPVGQAAAGLLAGKTSDQLNQLNQEKGVVAFETHPDQTYAMDVYDKVYDQSMLFSQQYESLNQGKYRVVNKLLITGSTDKVIARFSNLPNDIDEDSIRFVTGKGIAFKAEKKGSTYEVTVLSGPAGDAQELYAIYRDNEKIKANPQVNPAEFTYSLGKLKIATYEPKQLKITLVPVGNAIVSKEQISQRLNAIYKPIGISWTVSTAAAFTSSDWDGDKDGKLDITGAGKYNQYSSEMKALNLSYLQTESVDPSTAYLFVFDKAPKFGNDESGRAVLGDMLRNKQFGYLFLQGNNDQGQVTAHELGHGVFHLHHTFDDQYKLKVGDLPKNLMDYSGGDQLVKLQWDAVHAPGLVLGVFEKEGDAASLYHPYLKCIEDHSYAASLGKNFYDPDGNPVVLTSEMQPYAFFSNEEPEYYGRLAGYKKGGKTYMYLVKFVGSDQSYYNRWIATDATKPETQEQLNALTKLSSASSARHVKINDLCKETISGQIITNCHGCPATPVEVLRTNPKASSEGASGNGTVVNFSQDANGNSLIETVEADKLAAVINETNSKLGTKAKTYIINKKNKDFEELLAKANADPSKEKIIIIIDGTKNLHTINVQHKLDAPEWLRNAFAGVNTNSNGCVEDYINDALKTLHSSDTYQQASLAEQVTSETLVSIYRGIFGNLYCVTDEQSVANSSATKKFVAGAMHELVATVDVAEMVEGLAMVAKGIASSIIEAETSYIKDQMILCNSLVSNSTLSAEEVIQKMLPPKARLAVKAAETVTKVASHFTQFYFTECEGQAQFGSNMCPYRYGQVTVMIIPVVLTFGEWAWVKSGQMVSRLRTFNNLTKTEEVVGLISTAEKGGAEIAHEVNKVTLKDGDNLTTITKNGDEVNITESRLPSVIRQLISKPSYRPNRSIFSKSNKTTTFIGKWSEDVAGQENGLQKIYKELTSINDIPGKSTTDLNIYIESGKFDHPGGFNMLSIEDWDTRVVNEAAKKGILPNTKAFDDFIWESYNKPWLESAIRRGDDIVVWSNPFNLKKTIYIDGSFGPSFYERELEFLKNNSAANGFDYNRSIESGLFSK